MNPVPEDMSTSFQVDGQWYTMSMKSMFRIIRPVLGTGVTNREIVTWCKSQDWQMEKFGNFVHMRPAGE